MTSTDLNKDSSKRSFNPTPPSHTQPTLVHQPTIASLFSFLSRRNLCIYALPATVVSLFSGAIAPYMTSVVGRAFDAFAQFPLAAPSNDDRSRLLHGVGMAAIELLGLAVAALILGCITSALWVATGEHNVRALRIRVYDSVTTKELAWFDAKSGAETVTDVGSDNTPLGPGGLMSTFSRQTEEVRIASSLASGLLVQFLTTCFACLILAFLRSWSLTLVILSAIPALMLIQGLSQAMATPLLAAERSQLASASSILDRAVRAIATVKAHNASSYEQTIFASSLNRLRAIVLRLSTIWGISSGLAQFATMGMFVQGFWFGAHLVRSKSLSPGDVMAVFWACLIATSSLQRCIPQFIVLAKGKSAMASLLTLIDSTPPSPATAVTRKIIPFRKIVPSKCIGELALHNVTFTYPARSDVPVLQDVSLFLPAREMTFIVGMSGSGKSSIARLLLGLYAPQRGMIRLDNEDTAFLDPDWLRSHVACIADRDCVVIDGSVHDNVAIAVAGAGRDPSSVTREEVIDACRVALIHEFFRDLPQGYDTILGIGGGCLSGGQKQRLAIARAKLRNPAVLILDEATSALDPTSRGLVFEALKRWRLGKTTVVITHDISQIEPHDFVYVLHSGTIAEQGYRYDLEATNRGAFGKLLRTKSAGTVSTRMDQLSEKEPTKESTAPNPRLSRPISWGSWLFGLISDSTNDDTTSPVERPNSNLPPVLQQSFVPTAPLRRPSPAHTVTARHYPVPSLRSSSPALSSYSPSTGTPGKWVEDDLEFDTEKIALRRCATEASRRRPDARSRSAPATTVAVEKPSMKTVLSSSQSFLGLVRDLYPTIPCKLLVLLGLVACVLNGTMTPLFSFFLSRLIFEVSIGAANASFINVFGGIVLSIAALDGLFLGTKHFVMETAAMRWITHIRKVCYARVLAQDKRWFDRSENNPARLVQVLVKDGDDAGNLIAVVLGQCVVVAVMLTVGLMWSLVKGWQLTFVGLAIAPVFAGAMAFQTGLMARCEDRVKRATEEVAMSYYEAISNIRGIRCMALERVFRLQFDRATQSALAMGMRGAFVEGSTYGVANAFIYVAEAMLFYVGAVLIAKGTYTYLQMMEVLNLVVFTVTIGSQLLSCTQKIARSLQAARDFNSLLKLSEDTDESWGMLPPPPTGVVVFDKISFAYPGRPDTPVLKDMSMQISDGECVAVVGSSGSGKSTVAALLQRLYEPDTGSILIGSTDLRTMDVRQLREHVAIVSQHPHLFDATVAENIAYGCDGLLATDVKHVAQQANADEFITRLPQGYETLIGEEASLISMGQAQRLQIARALARPSRILILDECTSALDAANQAAVMEAVRRAKVGRTTIMITHKLPVMQMCDRILVMHDGRVAEEGTYQELIRRKGVFKSLANAGEWQGE